MFIVRIWKEPREITGAPPVWRGVIEHVPSGERRYVKDVFDIPMYIEPYLTKMGVKLTARERTRRFLNRLLSR